MLQTTALLSQMKYSSAGDIDIDVTAYLNLKLVGFYTQTMWTFLREFQENGYVYSILPSPGSDVSEQAQLVSACTHSLFLCARNPLCKISLAAWYLELRFAITKRAIRHCQEEDKRSIALSKILSVFHMNWVYHIEFSYMLLLLLVLS